MSAPQPQDPRQDPAAQAPAQAAAARASHDARQPSAPRERGGSDQPDAAGPDPYVLTLRLDGVTDKSGLLDRCAHDLRFPDWFGRNWDALADCLIDLSWLARPSGLPSGYVLRVVGWTAFRAAAPAVAGTAAEVLAEAQAYWADRGTPMTVLFDPDDPGLGPDGLGRTTPDRDGPEEG